MASSQSQEGEEGEDTKELKAAADQITLLANRLVNRNDRAHALVANIERRKFEILTLLKEAKARFNEEKARFIEQIEPVLVQALTMPSISRVTSLSLVDKPIEQPQLKHFRELLSQSALLISTYKKLEENENRTPKNQTLIRTIKEDYRHAISVLEIDRKGTQDEIIQTLAENIS